MEAFAWTFLALLVGIGAMFIFGCWVNLRSRREDIDSESEYHTAQQELCNRRKALLQTGLGRPSKSMTPAEWVAYRQLLAESDELAKNKRG